MEASDVSQHIAGDDVDMDQPVLASKSLLVLLDLPKERLAALQETGIVRKQLIVVFAVPKTKLKVQRDTGVISRKHAKALTLLGLPAELRIAIYRLAVVSDGPFVVDRNNHFIPGLTRTSRRLRREALSIFRTENKFELRIRDLRLEVPTRHWVHRHIEPRLNLLGGNFNWANLLEWLERWYTHDTWIAVLPCEEMQGVWEVIAQAFEMTTVVGDVPWEEMRKVLEVYRAGIAALAPHFWT